jgi:hypothetical protein
MGSPNPLRCHPVKWLKSLTLTERFWGIAGLIALVAFATFLVQVLRNQTWSHAVRTAAPVAGVLVALCSLVIAATGLALNWRRQRRESTLNAWTEWSDATRDDRRDLVRLLGRPVLSDAFGTALVNDSPLPPDGPQLDEDQRKDVRSTLIRVLSGLERLAVGVATHYTARAGASN